MLGEKEADRAVDGEGGSRRKIWVPGDTGTGIHMVVDGREAQFSLV